MTVETLNSYLFLIYVAGLSDQGVKVLCSHIYSQDILHVNVVNIKWQHKETGCPSRRKWPRWLPGDIFTALKCQPPPLPLPHPF